MPCKGLNKLNTTENSEINIFKISGRVIFSGEDGFYTYDDLTDTIIPYTQMNIDIPELKDCYKVIRQNDTKYWFVNNKYYSLVQYQDGKFHIYYQIPWSLFDNPPIEGVGNVFANEDKGVYLALNGSLARYDNSLIYENPAPPAMRIEEVLFFRTDDEAAGILKKPDEYGEVEYAYHNIKLSLLVSHLKDKKYDIVYRVDGLDKDNIWHNDIEKLEKTYPRLLPGEYTFKAVLSDNEGAISTVSYTFLIKRPFYLSNIAISLYVLLCLLLIVAILWVILKKASKKKNKKIEIQQKQIIELENERLEAEIQFKSKELSNFAMQSIKNKEILNHIKKELQSQSIKNYTPKVFYENLIRSIDKYINSEDDWAIFQLNFNHIHNNFFRSLKNFYPDLTSNDLRLCALLRLNLSSKDISNMMNISQRGIEAARYRLRKRLNLSSEQDLINFLMQVK